MNISEGDYKQRVVSVDDTSKFNHWVVDSNCEGIASVSSCYVDNGANDKTIKVVVVGEGNGSCTLSLFYTNFVDGTVKRTEIVPVQVIDTE